MECFQKIALLANKNFDMCYLIVYRERNCDGLFGFGKSHCHDIVLDDDGIANSNKAQIQECQVMILAGSEEIVFCFQQSMVFLVELTLPNETESKSNV